MERKSRPPELIKAHFYNTLIFEITEVELSVQEIRKEIFKFLKASNCLRGPAGLSGIDYSSDRVSGGSLKMSFADAISRIQSKEEELGIYLERLGELQRARERIEKFYENGNDVKAKVFYWRAIKKYTQEQAAEIIGVSERHLRRIEKSIKDEEKGVRI